MKQRNETEGRVPCTKSTGETGGNKETGPLYQINRMKRGTRPRVPPPVYQKEC